MEVDEPSKEENLGLSLRNRMLEQLSLSEEAHFKSQQRNEPDLTSQEKRQIAEEILDKDPACFLSRFGAYLLETDLDYFNDVALDNYEVNYYITDLRKKFQKTSNKSVVRNRRLEAIRRLSSNSEYFSDEEMRKRNPIMYEHLVGQYLTEDERMSLQSERIEAKSFTGIILNAIDEKEIEDRLKNESENEESETDSYDSIDMKCESTAGTWGEFTSTKELVLTSSQIKRNRKKRKQKLNLEPLSEEEMTIKMNEFRSLMYSEFLGGKDSDFDYTSVDANNDYDDLEMLEYDEQDEYFDSEPPEDVMKGEESSDSSISPGLPPPRDLVQKMADLET